MLVINSFVILTVTSKLRLYHHLAMSGARGLVMFSLEFQSLVVEPSKVVNP